MNAQLQTIFDDKRALRKQLTVKPIAEKLWMLESLCERTMALRPDASDAVPAEPWAIPAGWRWCRMGDVSTVIGGGTPRTDRQDFFKGDIPWITPADLSRYREKTIAHGARFISRDGLDNSGARLLPAGTVLFSSRAPIGYVAIASSPVSTNQGFKSFVLNNELTPEYVYYYLQRARPLALQLASGTTFLEISGKKAAQLPIPVPPLPDQLRIVAEIEKQFSRLDEGVAALKRAQANLTRYRAAVLKAACEGKLVPTEAALTRDKRSAARGRRSADAEQSGYETGSQLLARILTERRQKWQGRGKYKEPAAPETSKVPKLPEGWAWASVDQLCSHITSGSRDWSKYYGKGEGTFILAQNVRPMFLDMSERQSVAAPVGDAETERTRVHADDLLVTIVGAKTGDVCRIPNQLNDHFVCQSVALLRPTYHWLSSFMEVYLASRENGQAQWRDFIYGQGRPHLGFEQLRMTAIPLPPLAEQKRIVAEVERRLSVIDELESVVARNLKRTERLRQAVLQKAFKGGL